MKGGGACRAAEPSPAERCAPNREGEAGPQAAAGRWGTFVSPPPFSATGHGARLFEGSG